MLQGDTPIKPTMFLDANCLGSFWVLPPVYCAKVSWISQVVFIQSCHEGYHRYIVDSVALSEEHLSLIANSSTHASSVTDDIFVPASWMESSRNSTYCTCGYGGTHGWSDLASI